MALGIMYVAFLCTCTCIYINMYMYSMFCYLHVHNVLFRRDSNISVESHELQTVCENVDKIQESPKVMSMK